MWYAYVIGYFCSLAAHFLIDPIANRMWECLGWKGDNDIRFRPDVWQPRVVGVVERVLYTSALLMGKGEFIGLWVAIKAAGQWKRWGEEIEIDGRFLEGRSLYQNFLIGNALSILYAATGAQLVTWIGNGCKSGIVSPA